MVREPAVAGSFYPMNAKALRSQVESYLEGARFSPVAGAVFGLIAPHAGYVYSGPVAAFGYKALEGRSYETVVVIAPSHRMHFRGAAVMDEGGYRTPLGVVEIDRDLAVALLGAGKHVVAGAELHKGEHSLEVQLPFLQVVLGGFKLLPIIMGEQEVEACHSLSESLDAVIKASRKRCLVVGSTDLSHYYPYATAVEIDSMPVEHLERFDIDGMEGGMKSGRLEACGAGPMVTTMRTSKALGATRSRVMKYMNSGDVSGDKTGVVGYVSCVFYGDDKTAG